ncbi:MAG: hypothetical protein HWE27_06025 [Gammaproteobacteria bacterium]|nr:hypothetical protein [Gammaproteobacteria bacterium]
MLNLEPLKMIWTVAIAVVIAGLSFVLLQAASIDIGSSVIASGVSFCLSIIGSILIFNKKINTINIQSVQHNFEQTNLKRISKLEQERENLNQALNSNMKIMPGMLPKDKYTSIEWLRCIVSAHYLTLSYKRKALGENSIDWQVELLRLIQQEQVRESFELRLTRNQSIQAMNSYLNLLEDSDNKRYAA